MDTFHEYFLYVLTLKDCIVQIGEQMQMVAMLVRLSCTEIILISLSHGMLAGCITLQLTSIMSGRNGNRNVMLKELEN